MSQKKNFKKKFSILFIISRTEKMGHKDIDHILPFLYFLKKSNEIKLNVKLLFFTDEISFKKSMDPRIKFLYNLKDVEMIFLHDKNFLSKIKNLFILKNNLVLSSLIDKIINRINLKFLKITLF
jgi:hypothetical protein